MTTFVTLEEPYRSIQADARAVAASIEPFAAELDTMTTNDPRVQKALAESGLQDLMVPGSAGGRFEAVDPFAVTLVREVLMGTAAHADALFALQGIGSYAISIAGSDEQRERWLPRVVSGEALAALALTEPEAGSDVKAMTTEATPQGDGFVLRGHKSFISNAGEAAYYTVAAREGEGISAFLVPSDLPGVRVASGPALMTPHVIGDVHFDDVVLPAGSRIGDPGQGLELVLSTLAVFRVSVAGAAVGLAQRALDEAVRHARTREQFGRPLSRLGPVAGHLADAWADVAATRLLTYEAAKLAREDPRGHLDHSSLAKLAATEACGRVVDRCVQVMGRWGIVADSRIERCYRQARPMRIYEGASEVLRLGIARRLCAEVE